MSVSANIYHDCQSGGGGGGAGILVHQQQQQQPSVDHHLFLSNDSDSSFLIGGSDSIIMMQELLPAVLLSAECMPWLWAAIGSCLVGLSGILPLLVIPIDQTDNLKQGDSANRLKTLLSFAVGGLLGDVFLHSLPEIWTNEAARNGGQPSMYSGLLILSGLLIFVIAEKVFSVITQISEAEAKAEDDQKHHHHQLNNNTEGYTKRQQDEVADDKKDVANGKKHITGYLNLIANMIDNFTHGLSLGGAFLVSFRLGCLTTFAILVHEIPHEVGDFAILLKSGFSRWEAAKLQLITAGGGLLGSIAAIAFSGASNSIEARTSWIMPFTAGTFLHIALVTVLPDLLKEDDPKESFKQLSALLAGIAIMAFVTSVFE
ncbi:PREDICTED: zinc transporter ZIP13 homolog [Nicrophorus vespilloides]|uniref:Zinc transporter ZIP13 homolog n=1 Tax=Nicrophorus vespilloides TaxID=110193 RepID=A0ABM1MAL0_NICVS|nr:PREDICTED: zinc transporter ZIP13 homolog [Nicrophorus vespilloides]